MKDKVAIIIWILLGVLSLATIGYVIYGLTAPKASDIIEIDLDEDETVHTVEFENLCMIPGESSKYTLRLRNKGNKDFDLSFSFNETEQGALKNFVRVQIVAKGEVLSDDLLADLFESQTHVLPFSLENAESFDVEIIYYMPSEVTNEAQNSEASFNLVIQVVN